MFNSSPMRDEIEARHQAGEVVEGQVYEQARLDGLEIPGAWWERVQLKRSDLNSAQLNGVNWVDVEIANTGMRRVNLADAWLDGLRLTLCDLALLVAPGATLRDVTIEESPMPNAQLDGAVLSRVNFRVVDLQGCSLGDSVLLHCRFSDERLGGANLMGANLRGAFILDCDLTNANLQGADLRDAVLIGVDLRGANLDGAETRGAISWDVQGGPRVFHTLTDQREAHRALHQRMGRYGAAGRMAIEVAWSSLVEGVLSIQGGRDAASQILRQRNLSFADLMRFVKEKFPHPELEKLVVDGDQVGVRSNTGMVPLTEYSGGVSLGRSTPARTAGTPAAATNPSNPSSAPATPAAGAAAFRRGAGGGNAAPTSPAPAQVPPSATRPGSTPPPRPENADVFADDRFGLIDLDG